MPTRRFKGGSERARAGKIKEDTLARAWLKGHNDGLSIVKRIALWVIATPLALTLALAWGIRNRLFPLGVPGEWEWSRLRTQAPVRPFDIAVALMAPAAYGLFVGFGAHALARRPLRRIREAAMVALLFLSAVILQWIEIESAPYGYGLSRWPIGLGSMGAGGYYRFARTVVRDGSSFLEDYPRWIIDQDDLHIGTHPPGLFVLHHAVERFARSHPRFSASLAGHAPESIKDGFRAFQGKYGWEVPDLAAFMLIGAGTMLACCGTLVFVYLLARAETDAVTAWASAALWPLAPAAILFQPTADTAYPCLATAALAATAWSIRSDRGRLALAFAAGLALALGMFFTLAFLPVGFIAGLMHVLRREKRLERLAATALGFLIPVLLFWAVTGANPFLIWKWNLVHHSGFYKRFHRTYAMWVWVNAAELACAVSLPIAIWLSAALFRPPLPPKSTLATLATLVILDLSGRNLSEVGRLWLPFMPPLLIGAATFLARVRPAPVAIACAAAVVGVETALLEQLIQVIYPF